MKKLLLALALLLLPSAAWAQCTGTFPGATVCGVAAGPRGVPGPLPLSSFALSPGGTINQVQYNNGSGGLGGYTNTQLTALINTFTALLSGVVPASAGGTTNYLRADGAWAVPPGTTTANVIGTGTSVVDNLPKITNTTSTAITDSGIPSAALPVAIGQLPGATPIQCSPTITIASPAVLTCTAHRLQANQTVQFIPNGDTLPTGLSTYGALVGAVQPLNTYYVVGSSITANTFQLATSVANAIAGTAINTSGSQSGTHLISGNACAPSGYVGECIEYDVLVANAFNLPNGQSVVVGGTYPVGNWLCQGNVTYAAGSGNTFTELHHDISVGSTTLEGPPAGGSSFADHLPWLTGDTSIRPTGMRMVILASPTTLNVVVNLTITAGATNGYGQIWCIRFR